MVESGTHNFIFDRKGLIKIKAENIDTDELELQLIDFGLESMKVEDDELNIYTSFNDYGTMLKGLDEMGIEVDSAETIRIPTITKKLTEDQVDSIIKLIDKLEEEDDVTNVFHNMDMED